MNDEAYARAMRERCRPLACTAAGQCWMLYGGKVRLEHHSITKTPRCAECGDKLRMDRWQTPGQWIKEEHVLKLNEADFRDLVAGKTVRVDGQQIALADIGWERMIGAIVDAMGERGLKLADLIRFAARPEWPKGDDSDD